MTPRRALSGLFAVALASCSSDPPPLHFPVTFLWGTAIAPYQVEGGLHADDWYIFETGLCQGCSGDHADDGPDFWNNYDADLLRAEAIGTNAIRLGIEWARVFPTKTSWDTLTPDPVAVQHYHDILADAHRRGIDPMVTLHHFATPVYLMDPRDLTQFPGWESPAMADAFARWCGFAAREFGAQVDWWITINEPTAYIAAGWILGAFPPGKHFDFAGAMTVARNLITGHARAYDAIHANDPVARVSFATHNRVLLPSHPGDAADLHAVTVIRQFNNFMFLDALTAGNIDMDFDGRLDGPSDVRADPTLWHRLDYIGLNYYGVSFVTATGGANPAPFVGVTFQNDLDRFGLNDPINEFGTTIYPEGFRVVLDELRPYHLPILITENGVPDATDASRPRFLIDHLDVLAHAIADGFDIRGYYYWSLTDNFEWAAGFCPAFGLISVDRAAPGKPRTVRPSATVYQRIILDGFVAHELFDQYPNYPVTTRYCSRTGP